MKSIARSKTFWANLVAIAFMLFQPESLDKTVTLEVQASILAVINILLRLITKEKIIWK